MTDDSLDQLCREKILAQENTPLSHWPSSEALWNTFRKRRAQKKQRRTLWHTAAAALIIATAGYVYFDRSAQTQTLYGSLRTLSPEEQYAVDFIARYCAAKNISCNTPDMLELRHDLEQSFQKLNEIDQQLRVYGNDPELVRAKNRIESHQARLIKTIVQTL